MSTPAFFQPSDGWAGDVIPYERGGQLWLFYLHERREVPHPGTSWHVATTRDLVHLVDHGVSLAHGGLEDADFNAYTGSVIEDRGGVHHVFYTGQNPRRVGVDGRPLQLVMHASSADGMQTWVKHGEDTFGALDGFETADWRDPFVFWDEDEGLWRMLIAARHSAGPQRRRGVIAQCTSTDLQTWSPAAPFWDPGRYIAHECPEVFRVGDWWYLVYSEFSEAFVTRYRMARSLRGPWLAPERDSIDGRAFYAAKSAALGDRRFFIGWIASREGEVDDGAWQWAGTMSILQATQNLDGSLAFSIPGEIAGSFDTDVDAGLVATALQAPDGYAAVVGTEVLPDQCYIRVEFDIDPGTTECGLLVRTDADGECGYVVRLEPSRGRMVLDRWPRPVTGSGQWQVSGDIPFAIELERPADLTGGHHTLEVVLEGSIAVVVLDREVTLSTRLYDHPRGRLGVFVADGAAKVSDVQVMQRSTV